MSCKELLGAIDAGGRDAEPAAVMFEPRSSQVSAQLVADAIAHCGTQGNHDHDCTEIEDALRCEETSNEYQALARDDESEERCTFECRRYEQESVSPLSELAEKANEVIQQRACTVLVNASQPGPLGGAAVQSTTSWRSETQ